MLGERERERERGNSLPSLSINVLLFAITQVAVGAKRGEAEEKEKEKEKGEEKEKEGALGGTAPAVPFLSQSDLFRLVAASMRGHSNLAIFARANLKKHERLTRAKMLLITRAVV